MNKQVVLGIVGVFVGIVAGMIFMFMLHFGSLLIYPLPEGVDMMSQEPENQKKFMAYLESAPAGAFVLAALSHGLGCMMGAVVATLISRRKSLIPAMVIGAFFTLGGIMNILNIPHPSWFPFVDLPIYLIFAIVAGLLLRRKESTDEP